MTLEEYSELVIRALGFNNNEKIEERDVLGETDIVRAQIMDEMLKNGDSLTGEYVRPFEEVEILWDKDRKMHFSYLPCRVLNLRNYQAYRYVGPGDPESGWIPMTPAQVQVYSNLESGQAGGKTIFIPEGEKVFYRYLPVQPCTKVMMILVPSCLWMYEHRDDAEIIGIAGLEGQVKDLVIERLKERKQTPIMNYESKPGT